jgi:predicted kinase
MENINKTSLGKVIVLKSCSGGGKSTLAKKLTATEPNHVICSADDYHYFGLEKIPSNYKFDFNNLHAAHKTCQNKFVEALDKNVSLIVVDNTNIKMRDYKFYFLTAIEYGYEVEFHTIIGGNAEQYFKSNVHSVPRNVIEKMLEGLKPCPPEINGYTTKEIFYDFHELRKNK